MTHFQLRLLRRSPLHCLLLYLPLLRRGHHPPCQVNHPPSQTLGDLLMHLERLLRHHLPQQRRLRKTTSMTLSIMVRRLQGSLLCLLTLNPRLPHDVLRMPPRRTLMLASQRPTSRLRLRRPAVERPLHLAHPWTHARIAGRWTC